MKRLLCALATSVALVAPVSAAELFFDDFEDNVAGPNRTPVGWSLGAGAVDIVGPGYFPDICYNLGHCIDMDGSTGAAGTIRTNQSFVLVAGGEYTLSFDYTWNYFNQQNPNTMDFGVGAFVDTMTTSGTRGTSFINKMFQFVGDGSTGSIFFRHFGGDNGGIVIDNVRFDGPLPGNGNGIGNGNGGTTAVPLPAGLPLLVSGVLGLALLRRRRRV